MFDKRRVIALFFAMVLLVGCGGGGSTTGSQSTSDRPAAQPTAVKAPKGTVKVVTDSVLGQLLSDGDGMTLYTYANDEKEKSNCENFCLQSWPAYAAPEGPKAGEGVQASLLGSLKRSDGITQVTYNGWPLYQYRADVKPGEVKGQNSSQLWYVISPQGEINKKVPPAS